MKYSSIRVIFLINILVLTMAFPLSTLAGENDTKVQVVKSIPAYGEKLHNLKSVIIIIQFNKEVDPTIQEDVVLDQRGVIDQNGDPVEIKGKISWPNPKTLQFKAEEALKPSATYQISLFSVRTPDGEEMDDVPYRLVFTTGTGNK